MRIRFSAFVILLGWESLPPVRQLDLGFIQVELGFVGRFWPAAETLGCYDV